MQWIAFGFKSVHVGLSVLLCMDLSPLVIKINSLSSE